MLLGLMILGTAVSSAKAGAIEVQSSGGQTFWVEELVRGLSYPCSMAWLPNGDMLIGERLGALRVVRNGKLDPIPISGVPDRYQTLVDGVRDVAVDPDYQETRAIYLYLSEGSFDQHFSAIYRVQYDGLHRLTNAIRIFRSKDSLGGYGTITTRMMFLTDKTLLVALGEDYRNLAQELSSHKGKILRINRDGSVPGNNPFVHTPGALPEIWTYGHRVALGFYEDVATGTVWEVESGPRGGDELNILKPGKNYGWPKVSWGFSYGARGGASAPLQFAPGVEDPLHLWMPSVTPSGIVRYLGHAYPAWRGDFFVGELTTRNVERLRLDGQRVILQEQLLGNLDERIRDIKVGPDDRLYVLTDHQNGRVLRLQPGRPRTGQSERVAKKLDLPFELQGYDYPRDSEDAIANLTADDFAKGRQAFLERCAACHSVGDAIKGGEIGPNLANVYGRLMGHSADFNYSINMKDSIFEWNFATLNRFLSDPATFVPGTNMASPPVSDPQTRHSIIGFLKQHSQAP